MGLGGLLGSFWASARLLEESQRACELLFSLSTVPACCVWTR
jgi:hypothetical protein